MIPMNYTQWKLIHKQKVPAPTEAELATTFAKKYVAGEVVSLRAVDAARSAKTTAWVEAFDQMKIAGRNYETSAKTGSATAAQMPANLDTLVAALNALRRLCTSDEMAMTADKTTIRRYAGTAGWGSELDALKLVVAMVDTSLAKKLSVRAIGPAIPGIPWSTFKGKAAPSTPDAKPTAGAPAVLVNLIRDIRNTYRLQKDHNQSAILDTRTPDQQQRRDKSPDSPGSLRSWHMNQDGALPERKAGEAGNGLLHQHYSTNSQLPHNADTTQKVQKYTGKGAKDTTPTPIGYAEYTGTGIGADSHSSKIVLDYTNGDIFLTVTHYKRWHKEGSNFVVDNTKSGENSAWFYIDFSK